jgi:methionine-rich copper-binding protein CopC
MSGRGAFGMILLLASWHGAWPRPLHMIDCFPAAQAIVDRNNAQYIVRFDAPVDHRASRLVITQGGRIVRNLTPLLDAAPDVLFASEPRLPAGDYQLHWSAKSMPGGDFTDGSIPFTVGR